mgnify:CR=1 FL=1
MFPRVIIAALFALIVGIPFLMRPPQANRAHVGPEATLVIVTPHVPQIQYEFGLAFEKWHQRVHKSPVHVDWRQPGGTGEIIKQLASQYSSRCGEVIGRWKRENAAKLAPPVLDLTDEFPPGTVAFDLMLGGGSFDHGRLKDLATSAYWFHPFDRVGEEEVEVKATRAVDAAAVQNERQVTALVKRGDTEMLVRIPLAAFVDGMKAIEQLAAASKAEGGAAAVRAKVRLGLLERQAAVSMSMPVGVSKAQLDEWYGENKLGAGLLYDPEQYWLGTAISGFGIVYNKDILKTLGVPEPTSFEDMTDPRLQGWVVCADPRQSGSVATTIDSMLSYYEWEKGWKILRELCANTRYYTNSAPRPPIDVSQGEAAMGLAIDFYGRTQSQATLKPGQDPASGRVGYVDPKGAVYMDADPVSLMRGGPNPILARRFIEFTMTEEAQALWQFPAMIDPKSVTSPGGESGEKLGPQRNELRRMPARRVMYEKYMPFMIDQVNPFVIASNTKPAGWRGAIGVMMGAFAIDTAQDQYAAWRALCAARADKGFPAYRIAKMEALFYSFPATIMPDGTSMPFESKNVKAITGAWKEAMFKTRCEIAYAKYFRESYRKVTDLGRSAQ